MQVKHIARIGFASRRTAKKKRYFAVCCRMFRKIVIDDERMAARISKMLAERRARIGSNELKRSRVGSRCGDDRRIRNRGLLFEFCANGCDSRSLLPDRDVNTIDRLNAA